MTASASLSLAEIVEQFRAAMSDEGITTDAELIPDGKLHRVSVEGEGRSKRSGWYVLHADGVPAGGFGNWKTGTHGDWRADLGRNLTAEEQAGHRARLAELRIAREQEAAAVREAARIKAEKLWARAAELVKADHPYLRAKQVRAYGIRQLQRFLLVPVRSGGKLVGLQWIGPDGSKKFGLGTPKTGAYHAIGKSPDAGGTLVVAEGYATAATVHEIADWPVVTAFDAGNLKSVALALRRQHPGVRIVIAADNDHRTEGNPGLSKARDAARAVDGSVICPEFAAIDSGTDWNDYAIQHGKQSTAQALRNALAASLTLPPASTLHLQRHRSLRPRRCAKRLMTLRRSTVASSCAIRVCTGVAWGCGMASPTT